MADVEMQDASSAKDKVVKTSKSGAGEASDGKKRFEVKKVCIALLSHNSE
jgi:E3 ubiquitin-protein ligase RBX1